MGRDPDCAARKRGTCRVYSGNSFEYHEAEQN